MITIKCYYANNDTITTRINLTFEEAKKYYEGLPFNIGVGADNWQKCVKIELIK